MSFGLNIKSIREKKKMTQAQVAQILEIKGGTLGSYEECRAYPNHETLKKIVDYFKPADLYKFLFG